jgi:hypothetical protein
VWILYSRYRDGKLFLRDVLSSIMTRGHRVCMPFFVTTTVLASTMSRKPLTGTCVGVRDTDPY